MRKFLRLLRKDLEASKWPLTVLSGVSLIWHLFLRFKLESTWSKNEVMVLLWLPLLFLPFWLIWESFQTLRTEWREDTAYTLLVLPVPGWYITLSKLAGLLVEYTLLLAVNIGGILLMFKVRLPEMFGSLLVEIPISWLARTMFLVYLASLGVFAYLVVFIQLAFVVSKMVGRLQGLVAFWVLFLAGWFVSRMGQLLEPLFRWVPGVPLDKLFQTERIGVTFDSFIWNLSPQIGLWLATFGLFILTAWLLEKYVEIND